MFVWDPALLAVILLLGAVFGSAATVFCYRIPREIPLGLFSNVRSRCPSCETVIPWHRNVPLLSYLVLRGRCGSCQAPIPLRYFLIELLTTLLFGATYLVYANSTQPLVETWAWWAELVKLLYFAFSIVCIVFIDIEFRIIPDRFSLGNWIVALVASFVWSEPPIWDSLLGCLFGFGVFFLLAWGFERLKGKEGLGFGDVKMMGWLGAWVGFWAVPFTILSASITGLLAGVVAMRTSRDGLSTAIPFGPFLAIGAYASWALKTLGLF